jgi:predicted Zn-ribbon and HTH transcriptional regulator
MSKNPEKTVDVMGRKVTVEEQQCQRCKKSFWPIIRNGKICLPVHCPKCNSPYWNKPVKFSTISNARKK